MSNSSLAKNYIPADPSNCWGAREGKINKIIVHHMAAVWTAKRCAESFTSPSRGASATYCIGYDGEIVRCLDEDTVPGTSGGYEADCDAVTVEVANSKTGAPWEVSDKALNSLILLCADIAERNKLGKLVKGTNLCWHSMYDATSCPGAYLLSKMDYIAAEANKINESKTTNSGGRIVNIVLNELKKGSKGEQVKTVQRLLANMGYSSSSIDGDFGANTEKGVLAYQKAMGLTADGVIGGNTWNKLLKG